MQNICPYFLDRASLAMTNVIREIRGEGVMLLRLNRPDALDALNLPMRSDLAKWIVEADGG
jgi:enoyl-CoA hydratase/carnithine racemase